MIVISVYLLLDFLQLASPFKIDPKTLDKMQTGKSNPVLAMKTNIPGQHGYSYNTVSVKCAVGNGKGEKFKSIVLISILRKKLNSDAELLASLSSEGVTNGNGRTDVTTKSYLNDYETSELFVLWKSKDAGYCQTYICEITGVGYDSKYSSVTGQVLSPSVDGGPCG
ncbi:hypothetical protein PoB_003039400, partial [Plakobranchus ocellatus]